MAGFVIETAMSDVTNRYRQTSINDPFRPGTWQELGKLADTAYKSTSPAPRKAESNQ